MPPEGFGTVHRVAGGPMTPQVVQPHESPLYRATPTFIRVTG